MSLTVSTISFEEFKFLYRYLVTMMQYHEPGCNAKRLFWYLQGQSHSVG